MERSSSLERIQEIQRKNLSNSPKEDIQIVRWRGRRVALRTGSPFSVQILSEDPSTEEQKSKSPVSLLLRILRISQSSQS